VWTSLPVITGAQTETGGILCNVDSLWKDCANRRATEVVDLALLRRRGESIIEGQKEMLLPIPGKKGKETGGAQTC
jgi:hypothetical protein